jgi:hypothetical protein
MAKVYYKTTGKVKTVKNLGWLLRHSNDVNYFQVLVPNDCYNQTVLKAVCDDWTYCIDFASNIVLHGWLNRPSFKGVKVYWHDKPCLIGSDGYKALFN